MGLISTIKASLATNANTLYGSGELTVKVTLKNAAFGLDYNEELSCYIYAADYYPMCNSKVDSIPAFKWPVWTACLNCNHIWLPGKYTLLLREWDETLTRATLTISDRMKVKVTDVEVCPSLCPEDVLTTCLEDSNLSWREMAAVPGVGPLRRQVLKHVQLNVYNRLRKAMTSPMLGENKNLLICTANKDLTERTLNCFRELMAIDAPLKLVDCSTLFDITTNNPYEQLTEEICSESSATFCLTNISALLGTGGKVIVKRIVDKVRKSNGGCYLWICGMRQDVDSVLGMFPTMKDFFPRANRLQLKPYTAFDLVQAFFAAIAECGLEPSAQVIDALTKTVLHGAENGSLSSWTLADIRQFITEDVCPRFIDRAIASIDVDHPTPLIPADIDLTRLSGSQSAYEQSISELNAMIGLDDIKCGITTMANRTKFYMERRRLGLRTSDKAAFHAIFTGNPGTGKTTVARMLGKIYHSLGLLSRGDVIAVDRTRLVGRYIGETEENMKSLLEEARGNVLFIDEAYTLYDGSGDRKDYGARVIDSLLTVLSQSDPDMLIIFAGYEKEMDAMLSTNPGLFGRFPYKYRFKDYDAGQLMEIACQILSQDEYVLTDEARACLLTTIEQTLSQRSKNFGNARWAEQYVRNGIIPALADRVSQFNGIGTAALYQTIEAADVKVAYEKFNPKTIELRPRQQIGFSA